MYQAFYIDSVAVFKSLRVPAQYMQNLDLFFSDPILVSFSFVRCVVFDKRWHEFPPQVTY